MFNTQNEPVHRDKSLLAGQSQQDGKQPHHQPTAFNPFTAAGLPQKLFYKASAFPNTVPADAAKGGSSVPVTPPSKLAADSGVAAAAAAAATSSFSFHFATSHAATSSPQPLFAGSGVPRQAEPPSNVYGEFAAGSAGIRCMSSCMTCKSCDSAHSSKASGNPRLQSDVAVNVHSVLSRTQVAGVFACLTAALACCSSNQDTWHCY